MSFHTEILTRFESVLAEKNDEITQAVVDQIVKQHFHGQLPAEMVREFCEKFYLSPIESCPSLHFGCRLLCSYTYL